MTREQRARQQRVRMILHVTRYSSNLRLLSNHDPISCLGLLEGTGMAICPRTLRSREVKIREHGEDGTVRSSHANILLQS